MAVEFAPICLRQRNMHVMVRQIALARGEDAATLVLCHFTRLQQANRVRLQSHLFS
jgi:hypothetical protein